MKVICISWPCLHNFWVITSLHVLSFLLTECTCTPLWTLSSWALGHIERRVDAGLRHWQRHSDIHVYHGSEGQNGDSQGIVEKNARLTQAKQKEYYDRKARELNLQAGDKVLLLLPSSTKKFVAHWKDHIYCGQTNWESKLWDPYARQGRTHSC